MQFIQGSCPKCEDRGEVHGPRCIVRLLLQGEEVQPKALIPGRAMELAVEAVQKYLRRDKHLSNMGDVISLTGRLKMNLELLKEPFESEEIEFRLAQANETKNGVIWAQCLAYVQARAIMNRLDSVCGPANWKVAYEFIGERGVICNLSIRIDGEWVTKQDGAEETNIEAFKGGISSALKRAGNAWGMGRYLYSLETQFLPKENILLEKKAGALPGRTKTGKDFYWIPPSLPPEFLPKKHKNPGNLEKLGNLDETTKVKPKGIASTPKPTEAQTRRFFALANGIGWDSKQVKQELNERYGVDAVPALTRDQYKQITDEMEERQKRQQSDEPPAWVMEGY